MEVNSQGEVVVKSILQNLHTTLNAIDKIEIHTEKWVESPPTCPYYQSLVESQDFLYSFVSKAIDNNINTSPNGNASFGLVSHR